MKTMRNLFLLCAGLSLFACSSDDDATQQLPEGQAALTVKVALPGSRAIDDSPYTGESGDDKVELTGTIYVKLTADTGSDVKPIDNGNSVTFWGITNPTKVEAYVNGGKYVYDLNNGAQDDALINSSKNDDNDISDGSDNYNLQADAPGVPAYGYVESSSITLTTDTEIHNNTNYQMYTAEVTMEIPVARIEFSLKRTTASTKFESLNLAGVYLDQVKSTPDGAAADYKHKLDIDLVKNQVVTYKTNATGENAILYDYETSPAIDFTTNTAIAPETNKVYAYNVYPGSVPHIKFLFNNAAAIDANDYVVPYQYAVVKTYKKDSSPLTEFEAGKIYRVTALDLSDANLTTGESGTDAGIEYGIEVTVVEAIWDVVDITGDWSKPAQN